LTIKAALLGLDWLKVDPRRLSLPPATAIVSHGISQSPRTRAVSPPETFVSTLPAFHISTGRPIIIPANRNSITTHAFYRIDPGLSTHHVGASRPELRQRQPQKQCQRQIFCNNARRQLQQTKHQRIGWHSKHDCLEQRAHKHHGATGVQQEVCGGRRWWMWQDLSPDQLQPRRLPRGKCKLMRQNGEC
jgi:hypothetical protein